MSNITDVELYKLARKAARNAYAPFSGFRVGAAILTTTGEIFTGVNVENSSYGATICAERVACAKAISEGFRNFEAIAVATYSGYQAVPCGMCRQFLFEFAPNLKVIIGRDEENIEVTSLDELLPKGFRL
jgi:cytidine deaminase